MPSFMSVSRRARAAGILFAVPSLVQGCYPCDAEKACESAEQGEVVFVSEECIVKCGDDPDGGVADAGVTDGGSDQ